MVWSCLMLIRRTQSTRFVAFFKSAFRLICKTKTEVIATANQNRGDNTVSRWGLMVEISKLPEAWENASGEIAIRASFASDWLKKDGVRIIDQSQSNEKENQRNSRSLSTISWKLFQLGFPLKSSCDRTTNENVLVRYNQYYILMMF